MKKTLTKIALMAAITTTSFSCTLTPEAVYFNDQTKITQTIVLKLEAKEGETESLIGLIDTFATKSRSESGNMCVNVYQNIDTLTQFIIYEVWEDTVAMNGHLQSTNFNTFTTQDNVINSNKAVTVDIYERSIAPMPKSSNGSLVLFANINSIDGKEAEAQKILEGLIAPTIAEEGSEHYELHRQNGANGSGKFMFHETWTTVPLWEAHMKTPHLLNFLNIHADYINGGIDISRTKQIF